MLRISSSWDHFRSQWRLGVPCLEMYSDGTVHLTCVYKHRMFIEPLSPSSRLGFGRLLIRISGKTPAILKWDFLGCPQSFEALSCILHQLNHHYSLLNHSQLTSYPTIRHRTVCMLTAPWNEPPTPPKDLVIYRVYFSTSLCRQFAEAILLWRTDLQITAPAQGASPPNYQVRTTTLGTRNSWRCKEWTLRSRGGDSESTTNILIRSFISISSYTKKLNSVVLVRKRTIPTERPPHVGEDSANFSG
jgi:hypothetical protein